MPDISIIPSTISALAALVSASFAAYSAIALKKRHNQDLLEKKNEKEKIEQAAKRAQARKIATWIVEDNTAIIQNVSNMPIYNVLIVAVVVKGTGPNNAIDAMKNSSKYYRVFLQIPPGKYIEYLGVLEKDMGRQWGIEIIFTDCNENCWKINSKGVLSEITNKEYLYEEYQVINPPEFSNPVSTT